MAFITGAGLITIKNTSEDYYYFNGTNPSLSDNYTFTASQFSGYSKLDYVLVGGGGGGGGSVDNGEELTISGGGGSGNLQSSFSFNNTNGIFIYSVPNKSGTTISLTNVTQININIGSGGIGAQPPDTPYTTGDNGSNTILTITGGTGNTITASGGSGGVGASGSPPNYSLGGAGGNGYNGGGGGGAGQNGNIYPIPIPPGGSGDTTFGGTDGTILTYETDNYIASGNGGGIGEGAGYIINWNTTLTTFQINVGGGGGAGSAVKLTTGLNTGGNGTGGILLPPPDSVPLPTFPNATSGINYTGAGGGAGGASVSSSQISYLPGGNGGKGYAILWFHN